MSDLQKPATKAVVEVDFKRSRVGVPADIGEPPFDQLPEGRPVPFDQFVPLDVLAYLSGVNASSVWKVLVALHAIDVMTPYNPAHLIRVDAVPINKLEPSNPEHKHRLAAADKFVRKLAAQPMFVKFFETILFTGGRIRREVDGKGRQLSNDKRPVKP